MTSRAYTAQREDLASHGYVVAAIAHERDAGHGVPGRPREAFADEPWQANSGSEEASIA